LIIAKILKDQKFKADPIQVKLENFDLKNEQNQEKQQQYVTLIYEKQQGVSLQKIDSLLTELKSKTKTVSLAMKNLEEGFRKVRDSLSDEIEQNTKFLMNIYKSKPEEKKQTRLRRNRSCKKIKKSKLFKKYRNICRKP